MKIDFILAYNVDPDEMLHYVAFHLGLRCLLKYILGECHLISSLQGN